MDKKKLIGTIVGVVAFIALIAGATYAWLTFNATVTNGNYNVGSMNFSVTYAKGTDVSSVPTVSSPTTSNTAHLSVTASRSASSAPGNLTIYLNTDSSTTAALLSSGALHYKACVGACTDTDLSTGTNTGTVTATGKLAILSNTPLSTSSVTYNVYFWLDNASVTNELVSANASYTGFISAEALQTDH